MAVKIKKIRIIPVAENSEVPYFTQQLLEYLGPAREMIDKYGANYEHDTPWEENFLHDPKFYLYRVRIGAIGRVKTCEDAIRLGLIYRLPCHSYHFVSMALYLVFRVARQERRKVVYTKQMEKWINDLLSGAVPNTRFMEIYNAGQVNDEAEETTE